METITSSASFLQSETVYPDKITVVSREFESLFASMMLKAMRNTVTGGSLIPESMGEKIYTEMLDDEYAKLMSEGQTLGLAALIEKELRRQEGSNMSINTTAGLPSWMYQNGLLPSGGQSYHTAATDYAQLAKRVDKWFPLIEEAAQKYTVDPTLIAAVVAQESAGNQFAVSRAGAKGLMQLMDTTARNMGVIDSFNPAGNIDGGVKYLHELLDKYNGDESLALAAYNAGPGAVDKYGGIPPYRETRNYVGSVQILRKHFENRSVTTEVKE